MKSVERYLSMSFILFIIFIGHSPFATRLGAEQRREAPNAFFVTSHNSAQIQDDDRFPGISFEDDKPRLDKFAARLKEQPDTRAFIIVYGGRKGPRAEANSRIDCIKRYLTEKHGIKAEQIRIINGGYREKIDVELFLLKQNQEDPVATPTIKNNEIKVTMKQQRKCKL